jgi:single-stranded DNA-binding protein
MTSKTRSTTKTPQRSTTGNASASRRDDARKPVLTLYGNVGGNPETKTIPGQQITKPYYDPITDEVVDRDYRTPDRELRTFSIAVNYKEEGSDEKHTRWIQCADWKGLSRTVRKGDRLRVTGYFQERRYQNKKEEWKTVRTFTLVDLEIEHLSHRDEVA